MGLTTFKNSQTSIGWTRNISQNRLSEKYAQSAILKIDLFDITM
jgi:hypothetical protein